MPDTKLRLCTYSLSLTRHPSFKSWHHHLCFADEEIEAQRQSSISEICHSTPAGCSVHSKRQYALPEVRIGLGSRGPFLPKAASMPNLWYSQRLPAHISQIPSSPHSNAPRCLQASKLTELSSHVWPSRRNWVEIHLGPGLHEAVQLRPFTSSLSE